MMLVRSLPGLFAGLVVVIVIPNAALADEWQYCIAPNHQEHTIYMSGTFRSLAPGTADSSFEKVLNRTGLRYDVVQCPRADNETAIMDMMQYAVTYNKRGGNKIIYVDWRPDS